MRCLSFLFGLVLFLAILVPPLPLRAEPQLRVETTLTLEAAHSPYTFAGIEVTASGHLFIQPGVTVILTPGSSIHIIGQLEAVGEPTRPIIFTAAAPDFWEQFQADSTNLQVEYVQFQRFSRPVQLIQQPDRLDHLQLIDGQENVIEIGQATGSYAEFHPAFWYFANRTLGEDIHRFGIDIRGKRPKFTLSQSAFVTPHPNQMQLKVASLGGGIFFDQVDFPQGCLPQWQPQEEYEVVTADLKQCQTRTLPLLFVPGYGTSLNLHQLTQLPSITPQLEGWRFLESQNASYISFLRDLQLSRVPFGIAYYDWRLPAADIARLYLKPWIDRTKARFKAARVNLVAHSFGGIVARAYLQSDWYEGDVANLVEMGTPNFGVAKAYSAWEAAQLPNDWSILSDLVRYYQYIYQGGTLTELEAVHRFFPSAQELLPVYPALRLGMTNLDPTALIEKNQFLLDLNQRVATLFSRVPVLSFASDTESTLTHLRLLTSTKPPLWPDGEPYQPTPEPGGDGTVPLQSAQLPGSQFIPLTGNHNNLPAQASFEINQRLYHYFPYTHQTPTGKKSLIKDILTLIFDCPVEVTVQLPDGETRASSVPDPPFDQENDLVGEVLSSPEMTMLFLPKEVGTYLVTVRALEATTVRFWQDQGPPEEFALDKDGVHELSLLVTLIGSSVPGSPADSVAISSSSPPPASPSSPDPVPNATPIPVTSIPISLPRNSSTNPSKDVLPPTAPQVSASPLPPDLLKSKKIPPVINRPIRFYSILIILSMSLYIVYFWILCEDRDNDP